MISDFSLPTSIGHLTTPLQHPTRQGTLAQMVLWMLQHHLLMQLHTYVQFMPTDHGEFSDLNDVFKEDELHARKGDCAKGVVCDPDGPSMSSDGVIDDDDDDL